MKKMMTLAFAAMVALTLSMPAWAQSTKAAPTATAKTGEKKEEKKDDAKKKKADKKADKKKKGDKDDKKDTKK